MKKPTLGEQIRRERERQSLTQTRLAELAKCPQPYICRIEGGVHEPRLELLGRILNVLNMHMKIGAQNSRKRLEGVK